MMMGLIWSCGDLNMLSGNTLEMYNLFLKHKQLTDVDLQKHSDINPNSIRSARLKLEKLGLIRRTDYKKGKKSEYRKSSHHGYFTIYKLVKIIDPKTFCVEKKPFCKTMAINAIRRMKNQIKQMNNDLAVLLEKIS
jgi:hypothetical protein